MGEIRHISKIYSCSGGDRAVLFFYLYSCCRETNGDDTNSRKIVDWSPLVWICVRLGVLLSNVRIPPGNFFIRYKEIYMRVDDKKILKAAHYCNRECGRISYEVSTGKLTEEQANKQTARVGQKMVDAYGLLSSLHAYKAVLRALAVTKGNFTYNTDPDPAMVLTYGNHKAKQYRPAYIGGLTEFFKRWL